MALIRALLCALVAVASAASGASAEIVNAAFRPPSIDLENLVTLIEGDSPSVTVEIPPDATNGQTSLSLKAQGSGPVYRWAVFTLRNPDPAPRSLIAAQPSPGFVGSGLLWPAPKAAVMTTVRAAGGQSVEPLAVAGAEAMALMVPAGATQTYVIELAGEPLGLKLWQRASFEAATSFRALLAGGVIGVACLLASVLTVLALWRLRAMYATGAVFSWAAVGFIAMELGYNLPIPTGSPAATADRVQAIVESLMLAGLAGLAASLFDLRTQMPKTGIAAALTAGAALGLAVYGWFEPSIAAGVARLGFAAVVLGGAAVLAVLAWRDAPRAREATPFWAILVLWTCLAATALAPRAAPPLMSPLLVVGLLVAIAALAIALARIALGHGLQSGRLAQDAERRALALAGSEQAVWDWQVSRGRFFVGHELDRALGFESGTVGNRSLKGWIELVHPADRAAYVAAVEAAEQRGRGSLSHEFRLRRGDGGYRWFLLRARAVNEARRGLRLIGTLSDITSLRRSEDRLLTDAVHDRVTGLPNRALFLDRLKRAVKRAGAEEDLSLYVVVIGLDRFDRLNDSLGHEVGDSVLSIASRRLSAQISQEDTLARLRGDQFGLIFRASRPRREVNAFIEALRSALASPVSVRLREVMLTASFGVARLRHAELDPEELVKDAEIALYEAKRKRASVEFFHPDMRDERSRLLSLEQDLRRAVARSEIEVVFQPIIRLATRELAGFEALMRWRRGGEMLMEPDGFVGVAEEIGVIRELGRHVLSEAVRQVGIWHRAYRPREPLYVAVNLSSAELLNAELVDEVRSLLLREDVRPQALKLEVTESLVMQNPELAERILDRLRQMGVGLSCDDFGTGYSALANLRRLPFDTLKIDKAFLDHDDERAAILLESVLLLARDLQLEVVAEGIENDDQIARLTALGCEYGQGFHIGAPATAKQVIEALSGLPYGSGAKSGGMAAVWARFIGRRGASEVAQDPGQPSTDRAEQPEKPEQPELPPSSAEAPEDSRDAPPAPIDTVSGSKPEASGGAYSDATRRRDQAQLSVAPPAKSSVARKAEASAKGGEDEERVPDAIAAVPRLADVYKRYQREKLNKSFLELGRSGAGATDTTSGPPAEQPRPETIEPPKIEPTLPDAAETRLDHETNQPSPPSTVEKEEPSIEPQAAEATAEPAMAGEADGRGEARTHRLRRRLNRAARRRSGR